MDSNPNIPTRTPVKFKTLVRNAMGPKDAITEVLDDKDELESYRKSCGDPEASGLKYPVAFPDEVAVAVALGAKPSLGYDVQVVGVLRETGGFVGIQHYVLYVVTEPHGPAGGEVTYPHHVIRARGLHGIVHFRQLPDTLASALLEASAGTRMPAPTMPAPSTLAVGEEGGTPTTAATGEEMLTPAFGEDGGTFTTLRLGEEGPTMWFGEQPTSLWSPWEEHFTTFRLGEEGWPSDPRVEDPFGGQGGGRGPFG